MTLTVLVASFEPMTGPDRRLQFGLLGEDREPALDLDVRAHLVRADEATDATGALEPTFHGEGLGDRGVYVIETDLERDDVRFIPVEVFEDAGNTRPTSSRSCNSRPSRGRSSSPPTARSPSASTAAVVPSLLREAVEGV